MKIDLTSSELNKIFLHFAHWKIKILSFLLNSCWIFKAAIDWIISSFSSSV